MFEWPFYTGFTEFAFGREQLTKDSFLGGFSIRVKNVFCISKYKHVHKITLVLTQIGAIEKNFFCLFDLILYVPSTIFQL